MSIFRSRRYRQRRASFRGDKSAQLEVHCFRRFALFNNGIHVPISCKKAKELLALMILESKGPISKRHLAATLWPQADTEHARDNLYKTLHWLRARPALYDPFGLHIERENIRMDTSQLRIDLEEFDQCYALRNQPFYRQRALELYQGPLLEEEYYDWSMDYQSQYEIRYAELIK